MDFVGTAKDVVVVVDCENSDAQRLYDSLAFMKRFLRKIILVDDTHTNLMWDEVVREYREEGIPIEHDELPRLKEQKSLVDLRMVAKSLPTEDGFHFGDTEYNEGYIEDLRSTIEQIDKVLSETDWTVQTVCNEASW